MFFFKKAKQFLLFFRARIFFPIQGFGLKKEDIAQCLMLFYFLFVELSPEDAMEGGCDACKKRLVLFQFREKMDAPDAAFGYTRT